MYLLEFRYVTFNLFMDAHFLLYFFNAWQCLGNVNVLEMTPIEQFVPIRSHPALVCGRVLTLNPTPGPPAFPVRWCNLVHPDPPPPLPVRWCNLVHPDRLKRTLAVVVDGLSLRELQAHTDTLQTTLTLFPHQVYSIQLYTYTRVHLPMYSVCVDFPLMARQSAGLKYARCTH